jgi:hypothetical protein
MNITRFLLLTPIAVLVFNARPAAAQAYPPISARQFISGAVKIVVNGSFTVNADVPITTQASVGIGDMTWLQFGVSGSSSPEALITYGDNSATGITVGSGKNVATGGMMPGEKPTCTGTVQVTATLISAQYVCKGLTSHDSVQFREDQRRRRFQVTLTLKGMLAPV